MTSSGDIRAGRAYVELYMKNAAAMRGMKAVSGGLSRMGTIAKTAGKSMMLMGGAITAVFAKATMTFAGFQDQMALVGAVSGATGDQLNALTQQAKELGRTTSNTAAEVASLQAELGRAGFTPEEIIASTAQVQNLARATGTELADAASIAGATLRGFGMEASEATRVADVMTATANGSAQTLAELGEAMKMVAPLAAEAGATVEDTSAAIGILANNGIKGTMAGTALARAYKNLSSSAAQSKLKAIGVDAIDAAGNLRPVADVVQDIGQATAGMGSAQRLSIFEALFGRGQAAALKLAGSGSVFANLRGELQESAGVAAATATKMDDTVGGFFRRFMSAVEGVQIAIGESIGPVLRKYEDRILGAIGKVTAWVKANRQLVVGIAAWGVGLIAAGGALTALGVILGGAGAIISGLIAGITSIAGVLATIGAPALAAAAAIAAFWAAVAVVLYKAAEVSGLLDEMSDRFSGFAGTFQSTIDTVREAIANGDWKGAMEVAMAGAVLAFDSGVLEIKKGFLELVQSIYSSSSGLLTFAAAVALPGGSAAASIAGAASGLSAQIEAIDLQIQAIANIEARVSEGYQPPGFVEDLEEMVWEESPWTQPGGGGHTPPKVELADPEDVTDIDTSPAAVAQAARMLPKLTTFSAAGAIAAGFGGGQSPQDKLLEEQKKQTKLQQDAIDAAIGTTDAINQFAAGMAYV